MFSVKGSQVKGLPFTGDRGFTLGKEGEKVTYFLCLLLQFLPFLLEEGLTKGKIIGLRGGGGGFAIENFFFSSFKSGDVPSDSNMILSLCPDIILIELKCT